VTPERGGALLIRDGAIIPTWPVYQHLEKGWSPEVGLRVYPAADSRFTLYEDDGVSLGYRTGECARTCLHCETTGKTVTLTIGARQGRFAGMPATRNFTATIYLAHRPQSVTLDGAAVHDYRWDSKSSTLTVRIPDCGDKPRIVACKEG